MIFPSKILLFGEYTLLFGSKGLAIPFNQFYGKWIKDSADLKRRNWLDFFKHEKISTIIDVQRLENDLNQGYYFSSSIPEGHGVGSSGALVAALYYHYKKVHTDSLVEIKNQLAHLENIYHGDSSGIDPLVSLIKEPVLIESANEIKITKLPLETWKEIQSFFLIDSLVSRQSHELILKFKETIKENTHWEKELKGLKHLVNDAISAYQAVNKGNLDKLMYEISLVQFNLFKDFLPSSIYEIWKQGLESKEYIIKLCGAGGGGYFLGYRISGKEIYFPELPTLHF